LQEKSSENKNKNNNNLITIMIMIMIMIIIKRERKRRRLKRVTVLAGSRIEIIRIGSSISKLLECIFAKTLEQENAARERE